MVVRVVQPGMEIDPHALQARLDPVSFNVMSLLRAKVWHSCIRCADVEGAMVLYRYAEVERNLRRDFVVAVMLDVCTLVFFSLERSV